jgi:hypothetical protein
MSCSVYDTIPLKVLEKISALQEQAVDLERKARVMEADAQDFRTRAEDIVETYRERVEERGWEACHAEAQRKDSISWHCDPLPGAQS